MVRRTYLTLKATDCAPDGTISFTQTIDRIALNRETPSGKVEHDSAKGDVPPELAVFVGAAFGFQMSPNGEVSHVVLHESTQNRADTVPAAIAQVISPAAFRHLIPTQLLPKADPEIGDRWQEETSFTDATLGTRKLTTTYTYAGKEDAAGREISRIDATTEIEIIPAENAQIPVSVKSATTTSTIQFDQAVGHLISKTTKEFMEMGNDRARANRRLEDSTAS